MLGLDYWQTRAFLTEHKVYPLYDVEDFDGDMNVLTRLGMKREK